MTRKVIVNGRELSLRLEKQGDEVLFECEGRTGKASVIETEPGVYSVLIDGRSFEVRTGRDSIYVNGVAHAVEVHDPRSMTSGGAEAGAEGQQSIAAPMPGKVVRVLVSEGDTVEAGQGIVVVEAMKMQNELKASRSGRVVSLPVRVGVAVGSGDVLAIVE